jgi:uncharacterized repeat protein (TIGR03803 family)
MPRRRHLLAALIAAAISACSNAVPSTPNLYLGVPSVPYDRAASKKYAILHSFRDVPDGAAPLAGLIDENGTFLGTTSEGGKYAAGGTVFSMTATGKVRLLHHFGVGADGSRPIANLVDVGSVLYGTTYAGGKYGGGTVFRIKAGSERVLHSFGSGSDGGQPSSGLVPVNGSLYGTTPYGGAHYSRGTVYKISLNGVEKVLHSFGSGADGYNPNGALINVNATLYGVTCCGGTHSGGTIFRLSPAGTNEKVVFNFGGGHGGTDPVAALLRVKDTLYGVTYFGGRFGGGTVFSVGIDGTHYKTLHSFGGARDGANPASSLIKIGTELYSTTSLGGAYARGSHAGGTVFSITLSGRERVLHSFGHNKDGNYPVANLIHANGKLYGTTAVGGIIGVGTAFVLTPP